MTEHSTHDGDIIPPVVPIASEISTGFESTVEPLEIVEFPEKPAVETDDNRRHSNRSPLHVDTSPSRIRGVAEAMAWWFGTLLVHIGAGASLAIVLIIIRVFQGKARPADITDPQSMLYITAGEMILFVLAATLAVSLRFWGRAFHELNFSRPDSRHLWMVIGGTLPLTICVSAWSVPVQTGWNFVRESIPFLKFFDNLNTMEVIREMAENTSLPAMIFVVAVLPAIGEELVFRGAIGRVLIANIGLWGGVLLTSFLFGWMHIHPVHAFAVMPLGLAIHLVYLWSRSFWLPMLLHFLNNCWATIAAQNNAVDPIRHGVHMHLIDGFVMAVAVVGVIALSMGFWQSRVRLFDADGREVNDTRFPVRVSRFAGIHSQSRAMDAIYWRLAVVCMVLCHLMVVIDLIRS